ncbi:MAG: L-threonylcarbamoyladenylate synthase [Actinomycetia bacterium]|nr:L-threonylcarbamoyladenylate synthase [Actinomycetes bacterium]
MGQVFHVDQSDPSDEIVNHAASVLRGGGIVLLPTDTVYGLCCVLSDSVTTGAQELFDIKRRETGISIPVLVSKPTDLYVGGKDIPDYAKKLAETFWPGPLTIVVKASDRVKPEFRKKEDGSIALRCADSELVRKLILAAGGALFATSANTHQKPAPARFEDIEQRIIDAADCVLNGGDCAEGISSTIVVCTGDAPQVTREGSITEAQIKEALGA